MQHPVQWVRKAKNWRLDQILYKQDWGEHSAKSASEMYII